ncbi:MAG: hypothetical protein IKQ43_00215 [Treponema sp.]|nr:hypothetical protein [Treponema sp.]
MDKLKEITEKIMLVRTSEEVIEHRQSLFNAARKWWRANGDKIRDVDYVIVHVLGEGIVREVYKPDKMTWHEETDPGKKENNKPFEGSRMVFGTQDDSDEGDYCKTMIAPEKIRQKYIGKTLDEKYTKGQNPIRYTF